VDIVLQFFEWLTKRVGKEKCKDVLFCGDMFTPRNVINVPLYNLCLDTLASSGIVFNAILGNHDKYANADVHSLYAIAKAIPNYHILSPGVPKIIGNVEVWGLHAGTDKGIVVPPKPKGVRRILMLHELIFNTKLPAGEIRGSALALDELKQILKVCEFDICVAGDNHRPQIIGMDDSTWVHGSKVKLPVGSIVVVGAPYQMDFGDANQARGIWEYDPNSNSMIFVLWEDGQQFAAIDDDSFNDFIELCEPPYSPAFSKIYWHVQLSDERNIRTALENKLGKIRNVSLSVKNRKTDGAQNIVMSGNSLDYKSLLIKWLEKIVPAESDRFRLLDLGMRYVKEAIDEQQRGG
jgi:hypothetical protein